MCIYKLEGIQDICGQECAMLIFSFCQEQGLKKCFFLSPLININDECMVFRTFNEGGGFVFQMLISNNQLDE